MLDFLRRHSKSWLMVVAFGFIILSFVVWGGFRGKEEGQIAEVDGQYISRADYEKFYRDLLDMYRRQLGNSFSEDLIRQLGLEKRALDMMIQRHLVLKAAKKIGLNASSQEVQQVILQIPVIQTDGKFDKQKYDLFLRQSRRTPELFEQQLGEDLTLQKVEGFIKRRALITEDEILADFRFNHARIQIAYVLFNQKSYEDKVVMDGKAIQAFYQENAEKYKDPEKRQLAYVLFASDAHLGEVKVSEEQIRQSYEDHLPEYQKEKEVRARHILFSVKEDAPEDEVTKVRAEAQKVLEEAKKGKDFAELAKKHSQDPTAAQNAGDLGYFTPGKMVPAFSDAAFSMKPGEVSDLVRSPFGFHIIKVEDVRAEKTSSFEEVRSQIESTLKEQGARDVAFRKAREFTDFAYAQKDLDKAALARNLPLIGASAWLGKNDPLPGVDASPPEVSNKLFAFTDKEISEPLEIPKGFLVAQVKAIQAPQVIPFEKVKDRVEREFRLEESRKLAYKAASDFLQTAGKSKSLEEAAKELKMEAKKSDWFSRGEPDKDLRVLKGEAMSKVMQLTANQPFPEAPLEMGNRYLVCQLLDRKDPEENLEKERTAIMGRIQQQKQTMVWQIWMKEQERQADVRIFRQL